VVPNSALGGVLAKVAQAIAAFEVALTESPECITQVSRAAGKDTGRQRFAVEQLIDSTQEKRSQRPAVHALVTA